MATAELAAAEERSSSLPAGLLRASLLAYAFAWMSTAVVAVVVAAGPATVVRHWLDLTLTPDPRPTPGHVLWLAAHNLPTAGWPLLLTAIDAHRYELRRRIGDALVVGCLLANTAQVGAALGAYGLALLPYTPQLPLEWAGLALGACGWFLQRRRPMSSRTRLWTFVVVVTLIFAAAVLETVAVPHK